MCVSRTRTENTHTDMELYIFIEAFKWDQTHVPMCLHVVVWVWKFESREIKCLQAWMDVLYVSLFLFWPAAAATAISPLLIADDRIGATNEVAASKHDAQTVVIKWATFLILICLLKQNINAVAKTIFNGTCVRENVTLAHINISHTHTHSLPPFALFFGGRLRERKRVESGNVSDAWYSSSICSIVASKNVLNVNLL